MDKILEIEHLSTSFNSRDGRVHAVCDVSLSIQKGQIIGLVGETGCGKSVLGQSVLKLLPANAVMEGSIRLEGQELLSMKERELRAIRGKKIAYISQNPSEALNPVLKNGTQMKEAVRVCGGESRKRSVEISGQILGRLGFLNPEQIMDSYPVELSGGMKQRVLAAMAMSGSPLLLIADEPTKGLDALIRGQVINTLKKFIDATGCSALIITHDLKFASAICDTLAVMYAGEIVEIGRTDEVFGNPQHPYLKALIASQPQNGLHVLEGSSCSLVKLPGGCRFADRCTGAGEKCGHSHPELRNYRQDHYVRCTKGG